MLLGFYYINHTLNNLLNILSLNLKIKMEPEIKELLNHKLIPDLVNIITDYLLTPLEYFKLIDYKKYTHDTYYKFRTKYEKRRAMEIYQGYNPTQIYKSVWTQIENDLKSIDFKGDV